MDPQDPQEENFEATPELYITEAEYKKCEHYFIRISATSFSCKKCTAGWIDNGEFRFKNGQFVDFLKPQA